MVVSVHVVNRGSFVSAHVLFNLLNKLGKSDKMQGFLNEFDKFNNTGAHILDFFCHMT